MDKLKLSALIRLGAQQTGQATGCLITADGKDTCAMGAAIYAKRVGPFDESTIGNPAKELGIADVRIPAAQSPYQFRFSKQPDFYGLGGVIVRLNYTMKWSRERIADWLESIGY